MPFAPMVSRSLGHLRVRAKVRLAEVAARSGSHIRWRWFSEAAPQTAKPYYITSPIFYVNAAPHIGHLYTLILSDVLKRWQVLNGRHAILCTGTDEHGMKIQRAAAKAKMSPQTFCDQNSQGFVSLAEAGQIDYNHFIRTSQPEHHFAVQHFWLMLKERGHIYTSKHEGWYSVSDETFYPDSAVHVVLDPSTGLKFMASMETGSEVEWTSEDNYHFRLSSFRDRLLEHYAQNPDFIVPRMRMKNVVQSVEEGLTDLSISRPRERLSWGIPVPDDESQTIYVWLDALINYLTKTNYPFHIPGQKHAAGWPADVQVIGKDIVRFHCIYWPAFLMALDIDLPRQILTHAHWTLGHRKMSKSLGNVVNPFFALDRFGPDPLRYFMIRDGGIQNDTAYDNSYIVKRHRTELSAILGNLLRRINRSDFSDVREAVQVAVKMSWHSSNSRAKELIGIISSLPSDVTRRYESLDPSSALSDIMNVLKETNKFISDLRPWNLGAEVHTREEQLFVVALCAESLRICGILLQPVIPESSNKLLDQLNVALEKRQYVHTAFASESSFGYPRFHEATAGLLFEHLKSIG